MTNTSYRLWSPPIHTGILDAHGWLQDMMSAHEFINRLIKTYRESSPDPKLLDAYCIAALIRYSRCFSKGGRERLDFSSLPESTEAEKQTHEYLIGTRDWHVAHPVNKQEVHAVHIVFDEHPDATTGAIGLSSFSSAYLALLPEDAEKGLQLCQRWINWLNERIAAEHELLKPYAQQLTRTDIQALPVDEPEPNQNLGARRTQRTKPKMPL